jgi:hypothetical protein
LLSSVSFKGMIFEGLLLLVNCSGLLSGCSMVNTLVNGKDEKTASERAGILNGSPAAVKCRPEVGKMHVMVAHSADFSYMVKQLPLASRFFPFRGKHMNPLTPPLDISKAETIIYHIPDGPSLAVSADSVVEYFDIDLTSGYICDTSAIDGNIHVFPRGNA